MISSIHKIRYYIDKSNMYSSLVGAGAIITSVLFYNEDYRAGGIVAALTGLALLLRLRSKRHVGRNLEMIRERFSFLLEDALESEKREDELYFIWGPPNFRRKKTISSRERFFELEGIL